jgi:hypothetical protein
MEDNTQACVAILKLTVDGAENVEYHKIIHIPRWILHRCEHVHIRDGLSSDFDQGTIAINLIEEGVVEITPVGQPIFVVCERFSDEQSLKHAGEELARRKWTRKTA